MQCNDMRKRVSYHLYATYSISFLFGHLHAQHEMLVTMNSNQFIPLKANVTIEALSQIRDLCYL